MTKAILTRCAASSLTLMLIGVLPRFAYAQDSQPATGSTFASWLEIAIILLVVILISSLIAKVWKKQAAKRGNTTLSNSSAGGPGRILRGIFLSIAGAVVGAMVGYLTRPYTESDMFLTSGQVNQAVQTVGVHMMLAIAIGLIVGFVLNLLIPAQKSS